MCIQELGNNKYRLILSSGYKLNGERKRITKTVTAKSKREAEKMAVAMQAELDGDNNDILTDTTTFTELVKRYKALGMADLAEKTKQRYNGLIDEHFVPAFGKKKLRDISTVHIDEYLSTLRKDGVRRDGKEGGLSAKTQRHHYTTLHKIFEQARAWKLVSENPCSLANKPKLIKTEARYLDIEQTKQMLLSLNSEQLKYRVFVNTAIFTGARRSEILGLQWGDIELDRGIITIRRVNQYTPEKGVYTQDTTKNGTPVRTVVVPKGLCDILRHYKNSVGLCGDSNWIFTKDEELDKPMHPDTPSQWFARFLKRNNLPIITLHQLRHTSVSIMIFQGVDIHTIASQRGHSANVMLGTYAHVMNRAKTEAADKLQNEFF